MGACSTVVRDGIVQVHSDPDVFSIEVPLWGCSLRALNCYVVRDGGEALVIDTGFRSRRGREAIQSALAALDVSLDETSLYMTHYHSDHSGLFQSLLPEDRPRYMSAVDKELLVSFAGGEYEWYWSPFDDTGLPAGFSDDLQDQFDSSFEDVAYARDHIIGLDEGATVRVGACEFEMLAMPGHTPGNTCLYSPSEKLIFLGDHVLFDISPNVTYSPDFPHMLQSFLDSLRRVATLPIEAYFPGHRFNARGLTVAERAEELVVHHEGRLADIRAALMTHPEQLSAYAITEQIPWVSRGKGFAGLDNLQKLFALTETLAHLELLLDRGEVARKKVGATMYYRLA